MDGLALFWMKAHLPTFFPLLQRVEILLEDLSDLTHLYRSPSSPNNLVSDEVHSGKSKLSLMNARKYSGPFTVPWGTPEETSAWSDVFPSYPYPTSYFHTAYQIFAISNNIPNRKKY